MLQRSGYFNQSGSILPRHDGLGTFPVSTPPIQEQLWHFEQYNPRKRSIGGHQRRRSSVQRKLDAIENHDAAVIESERTQRIEKWRLEQSRILLDEIEKQTRTRSISTTSWRVERDTGNVGLERIIKESVEARTETHITDTIQGGNSAGPEDNESFWQRVTRRVIRDFIGIDDSMLSVIFGESVVEERSAAARNPSAGPASSKSIRLDPTIPNTSTWESRLLDRIARELGILVKHLSDHPGAFSIPLNPSTPDYAGIPITVPTSSRSQRKPPLFPANLSPTSFTFPPTLQDAPHLNSPSTADSTHAALWGIEEESPTPDPNQDDLSYWESPPDLKTIFRFLHTRFTSSRPPPRPLNKNIATTSTPDSLRRAAIIRQYHPLVSSTSRAAATWEQRRRGSMRRGRSGSSCASSIVGSARRLGGLRGGSLGSSSRNYWDLGGSAVGSGGASAIGVGGMGAWGEV